MSEESAPGIAARIKEKTAPFFERVGSLSKRQRILICLLVFGLIAGAYYYFFYMQKQQQIKALENEYVQLSGQLKIFRAKASTLEANVREMAEKQALFNEALKALPDSKEIPELLTGISRSGNNAGLEFVLLQPMADVRKEYYVEIPVSMKVRGSFHQVADFFYQVSNLYRIVNLRDIRMGQARGADVLETSCSAVTYMFVEKQEEAEPAQETGKGRNRRRTQG